MASDSHPRLTRLANSVLQPGFAGTTAPDWVRRRIADGLASVVLFGRNIESPEQVAALTAALRAENPDLIVAIDEEAGDVTRIGARTGASWPGNLALGAIDDPDLTEQVARDIGRHLRAIGVSLDFAPSADVNSNAMNPVIGVRSFGASTDVVARQTAAWIRGLQSVGVAACAKHFPGHGDTDVDSHHGLPRFTADADEIARTALPPFAAAMDAGVRAVMTAHMLVPAHDSELPATLSGPIINGLLREQLGFTGLVVTDGIEMGAVTGPYGITGATVRAVAAGVDAVCVGGESAEESTTVDLADALVRAVLDGTLPEERLTEAAARVGEFATWSAALARQADPDADTSDIGLVAARRAVRVHRSGNGAGLPLTADPHVVELSPTMSLAVDGATPWGVGEPLRALRPGTTSVRISESELTGQDDLLDRVALAPANGRDLIVVVRDAARHPWMSQALQGLVRRRPDALVVEMGVPAGEQVGAVHLTTYGATRVSGIAVAEVLVGAS
ncbi:glycoside hydrolase family 3 protein [Streptomyces flavofungini]|uniref:Glycoside hydrolase family 3 protein n=1 Tax=Streptomyces flavofungini TaxID=68200 RepID=A0ABS0X7N4_9ACTN|nr:glycoside hydrolase family 3 protein [Streptomyces flavofungini]MBJ3808984.1 glycoside hydrolase family 3 protein [Streptomyces flavofungini]GHC67991.1 hydrolase [Streptomyces flavofungini]